MNVKPYYLKNAFYVYFLSWEQKVRTLANNQYHISVSKRFEIQQI